MLCDIIIERSLKCQRVIVSTRLLTCPQCQAQLDLSLTLTLRSLKPAEPWRQMPIAELGLSVRAINCFKNENDAFPEEGWATAGDLDAKTDNEMLRLPNFGKSSLLEVRMVLERMRKHVD